MKWHFFLSIFHEMENLNESNAREKNTLPDFRKFAKSNRLHQVTPWSSRMVGSRYSRVAHAGSMLRNPLLAACFPPPAGFASSEEGDSERPAK
ncbi:MAG TPA: hypothetical protein VMJ11_15725 [Paraburkholderia sp.]|uniref:hypothetical protein n=1 Tax=Paraburkholderia sp. TaxID=1926495 RepID=UPI002B62DF14|nr:hypothetical protein [Paraburkholderia sp.]HTR08063.1 hypothetical protein [Paraburkholderia sp.]